MSEEEQTPEEVTSAPAPAEADTPPPGPSGDASKKIPAGILGILLGTLGIHKFYLGYNKEGIIMLAVAIVGGIVTCGIGASVVGIIGLVEGILYLTKSDEEFVQTYIENQKPWF